MNDPNPIDIEARPDPDAVPAGPSQDERTWGMVNHLSALSVYLGVPLGHVLVPLIIWFIKRKQSAFLDRNGKAAVNFQLSMLIYSVAAALATVILIGFVALAGLVILHIFCVITGAVKAHKGEVYAYPLTIRFIK